MTDEGIDILFKAMKAARKAFEDYIDKRGYDAAYWELGELTGYVLSSHDFSRLEKLVLADDLINKEAESG